MTKEQQRIAIAEACGWTKVIGGLQPRGDSTPKWWRCPKGRELRSIPDYLNDLNAMHDAEKTLSEKRIRSYAFTLAQVLDTSPTVDLDDQFLNIHATAAQRAEAFLRTINKWEETKL